MPSARLLKEIPTIDVSAGFQCAQVRSLLFDASCEWGFFQIVGHGVDVNLRTTFFSAMNDFFSLPHTNKLALSRSQDNFWGYYDKELTKNKRDSKEIYDINASPTQTIEENNKIPWPQELPQLKPIAQQWLVSCEAMSLDLINALCASLGESPTILNKHFAESHSSYLRLNHYPANKQVVAGEEKNTSGLGIHPHTDAGALTILVQDDVPGLQVRKDDQWHTVIPEKDSFIVNIGDMLQVWSNDRFRAAEHRVLASGNMPRYSAPYFYNPSYDTVCQPFKQDGRNSHYRPIPWDEFREGRAAGDYADQGEEIQISWYRI